MSTVYILHGWTTSLDKWDKFLQLLKNSGLDPILFRIPGLTEKTDKVWNLDTYVEWLNEKVNREKSKVILIGHSSGGRMAIAFAAKYPEKLKYLILIDSAGIYHNELSLRLKRFLFKGIAKLGKKLTSSEKLRDFLYKLAREKDYKDASPMQRQTMINLISVDLTNKLQDIKTPALIIWGKQDSTTSLSDGKLMHRLIKNSKLHIIEDAKHSPMFTHPQKVCEIITSEVSE